jgi:cyclase
MADQVNRHQTRRELLKAAMGAAGIVLGAPVLRLGGAWAQGVAESEGTLKLADDLFVLRMPGQANVIAQIDAKGVVLVDGGSAAGSDALLKAVAGLPNAGTVHTLFNTHWHLEQTGSNERLGKAGATIIAHENTRLWLQQNVTWPWGGTVKKLPKIAQPNKTFYES